VCDWFSLGRGQGREERKMVDGGGKCGERRRRGGGGDPKRKEKGRGAPPPLKRAVFTVFYGLGFLYNSS